MAAAAQIGSDPLGAVRQMIPFWYGEGFLEANPGVDELMAAMLADHPVRRLPALDGPHGLSSWSVQDRLAEIKVPTLVCHGVYDRLIPVAEGKAVFDGISGAELRLFHAVHSFSAHDKDSVIGGIAAWLQAHS
jgi:pimeloyl-ACP methyl ester carboxylesterase